MIGLGLARRLEGFLDRQPKMDMLLGCVVERRGTKNQYFFMKTAQRERGNERNSLSIATTSGQGSHFTFYDYVQFRDERMMIQ